MTSTSQHLEKLPLWMWVVLVSFWMLSHPWEGIRHDGILYAAQAMLHVRPEIFSKDLFFLYGSQDKYTVFGLIYSHATELLGLVTASRLLWGLSQITWFLVAVAWIRHVFNPRHLLLVASVTFALPVYYSSDELLRLAESFLTARSFAEPLALGGLLAMIAKRKLIGSLSLAAAVAVHPVMAVPALVVTIAYLGLSRLLWSRSQCILVAIAGSSVLVVVIGTMPRVDEDWLRHLAIRSPFLLTTEWRLRDWVTMLYPPVLLMLLSHRMPGTFCTVWRLIGYCAFMGIALATIASISKWELGLQAQFWRFSWLAAWAAPIVVLATVLCPSANAGYSFAYRLLVAASIPVLWLLLAGWSPVGAYLALMHIALLALSAERQVSDAVMLRRVAIIVLLAVTTVAVITGLFSVYAIWVVKISESGSVIPFVIRQVREYFGWSILAAIACCFNLGRTRKWRGYKMAIAAGIAFGTAAILLDGRSLYRYSSHLDGAILEGIPEWERLVPSDSSVYWPGRLPYTWFVLGRRSYVSQIQLAGGVFFRQTAKEGERRLEQVSAIGGHWADLDFRMRQAAPPIVEHDLRMLQQACRDPLLSFVVLDRQLPPAIADSYFDRSFAREYFLHDCRHYR